MSKRTGRYANSGPRNLSGLRGASKVLRIRRPDDLMALIEAAAELRGMSVADWCREALRVRAEEDLHNAGGKRSDD